MRKDETKPFTLDFLRDKRRRLALIMGKESTLQTTKIRDEEMMRECWREQRRRFPGLLEEHDIKDPLKLKFRSEPIIKESRRYDGYVHRDTGIVEIHGIDVWRIPETIRHELLHFKITKPLFPLEDFINKIYYKIEDLGKRYPEIRSDVEELLETYIHEAKEAIEENYSITEYDILPYFQTKYLRPGTLEEWEAQEMAEERVEEASEELRMEWEEEREYGEERDDIWDIKG